MSGGHWGYQSHWIREYAEHFREDSKVARFINAVADSEHIVDWAESGDTDVATAQRRLYDLWFDTFEEAFAEYR